MYLLVVYLYNNEGNIKIIKLPIWYTKEGKTMRKKDQKEYEDLDIVAELKDEYRQLIKINGKWTEEKEDNE